MLPLLVLHLIAQGPSYGNQLMERIAGMTAGVLSVNPNTMYPLLRQLESRGLIAGEWEHPERRTRRYYSLTDEGRAEYERLVEEVRPFLDSVKTSIDEIVREVYGGEDGERRGRGAAGARGGAAAVDRRVALAELRRGLRPRGRAGPELARARAAGLIWESMPAGRGRVTEKVAESAPGRFATLVFEDRLSGRQTFRAIESEGGARVELSLEYTLTELRPARAGRGRDLHPARAARLAAPHDRRASQSRGRGGLR